MEREVTGSECWGWDGWVVLGRSVIKLETGKDQRQWDTKAGLKCDVVKTISLEMIL